MLIYETVLILKPVMSDPEVAEYLEKLKQTITAEGGEIVNHEIWGRRKLTHIIGKAREGVYLYIKYKSPPALLKKLAHNFSVSDDVMTVLAQDRKMREKKPKKAKPAAAAAAAPSASASAQA
jgi:small subunit ribosomal protein S6